MNNFRIHNIRLELSKTTLDKNWVLFIDLINDKDEKKYTALGMSEIRSVRSLIKDLRGFADELEKLGSH